MHRRRIPDLVRRALRAGFSGIFMTGEALREALGDSVPREWADFAADQSARTRSEFIERMSVEMGRALEKHRLGRRCSPRCSRGARSR